MKSEGNTLRVPLLLRSSPAAGTGSYGALPTASLTSSDGGSDEDRGQQARRRSHQSAKKRGKSRLSIGHRSSDDESQLLEIRRQSDGDTSFADCVTVQHVRADRSTASHRNKAAPSALSDASNTIACDSSETSCDDGDVDGPSLSHSGRGRSQAATASMYDTEDSQTEDSSIDEPASIKISDDLDPIDNSPYAQVRASVRATDNIDLSINTPRMWVLSMLFAILGSSTNLFFSLRYPSVSITPIIALLLVHPLGHLWDQFLKRSDDPDETFYNGSKVDYSTIPSTPLSTSFQPEPSFIGHGQAGQRADGKVQASQAWTRRLRLWLAQGEWNEKEHCCVYIASNVSFGFAFATDVIVEQTQFYKQDLGVTYQILLTISTQVLGYAMAGLTRNYLVRPSGMIWPGTLISTSMFSTLHKEENVPADGWTISRSKFFLWIFLGSVSFYFLPGLLFPALSYFSVVTWFFPNSVVVANLFGIASGLGMFPLTFDWSQIAYIGSPLVVPFWAALNIIGGLVVVMWLAAPIMYYANVMFSSYMPILSSIVFDNTGKPYDVSRILTSDFVFDENAYQNYSRVFLPITYVLSYALQFAALSALITHTACWHGKDIVRQWKRSWREIQSQRHASYEPVPPSPISPLIRRPRSQRSMMASDPGLDNIMGAEDVHNRLMRRYEDVPIWWYVLTGASMAAIGIFVVEYYPVHLPWYGLLLALGICCILFIPIGIVMAITNQQSSLYLICQLICGSVFPGRPVANMVFVTYGYITSTQGLKFSSDLKLGHYMKIPPRTLFTVQLAATLVSSFTQIGVLNWMLAHIPGICTSAAINGFTCPIARVHFNGSILWGVVGPARFFGAGALYRPLVWAFLVGALAPIGVWLLGRKNRKNLWRKVNLPVVFGSLSWIPPATGLNFSVWFLVCWVFNDVIMKRRNAWWRKYNMTLSAALDSGLAVGVVVVFFGVVYPGWSWMEGFKWWGTEVFKKGCDWRACAYSTVGEGERFGPDHW